MTNPTNPQGAAGGAKGSTGSWVDDSVRAGADSPGKSAPGKPVPGASPWAREPQLTEPVRPAESSPPSASETTSALPVVDGGTDPFVALPPAPSQPPGRSEAAQRPAPVNAVDQYAAVAGASARGGPFAGSAGSAGPGMIGRPVPAPVPPGLPRAAVPLPPVAASPTVKPAKAIRRPKAAKSPRRAKLQLRHLNVWSVLRFSCVLAIALFFVWLIMVGVLYGVLDVTHVFSKINDTVRTINGDDTKNVITPGVVFGGAFIIGLVNIVLFIALSTIGSIVYNLCADLVGGIEVTLAEHE